MTKGEATSAHNHFLVLPIKLILGVLSMYPEGFFNKKSIELRQLFRAKCVRRAMALLPE